MTIGTIFNHLEQLKEKKIIVPARDLHILSEIPTASRRWRRFSKVFAKTKELKLSPVRELLDDSFSYDELRLARLFPSSL